MDKMRPWAAAGTVALEIFAHKTAPCTIILDCPKQKTNIKES